MWADAEAGAGRTNYQPFVAGLKVPGFALAKDVKPWVINWE